MKRLLKIGGLAIGVLVVLAAYPAYRISVEIRKALDDDPAVYTEDIAELVARTRAGPAPEGAVVFIGSSSIRLWSTLERDMQPLPVIQHGFGGAKLADVEFYADTLVNAFHPRAVVVFAGTNDIHPLSSTAPETLFETYQGFVARVRTDLPEVPIYFIGITPSPRRWSVWERAQETNRLVRAWSDRDPSLFYIETGPALLGEDGEPDPDHYRLDGLHLSPQGYAIWTEIIRTRLMTDLQPLPPSSAP
ncbi:MAG: GDSL-type esterase/lipase family protein [Myxococcota bacterium]|nr:GDSL-type esterase/lipase family protein [Myxococcota bacterium]